MKEDELAVAEREGGEIGGRGLDEGIRGVQRRLVYIEFGSGRIRAEESIVSQSQQAGYRALRGYSCVVEKAGIDLCAVRVLWTGEGFLDSADLLRDDASVCLAGFACEDHGIEIAANWIRDHTVGYAIFRVALLHEGVHEKLAIGVIEELVYLRLAGGIFGGRLVISHGDPLGDGEVRQAGAHGWITGNDSIESGGIPLREDHAFAAASGTADKIGVCRWFSVVVRDDLPGDTGDFRVGEESEVEICLLVAHEGEVEGTDLRLVPGVGAGYGESASECRLVAGVVCTYRIGHDAIAASAALHHEVAVPGGTLAVSYT